MAVLLLAAGDVHASFARMSIGELVDRSDLVVVGELIDVQPQVGSAFDHGTIRIEEVLLGPAEVTEALLAVPSRSRGLRSSADVHYASGQHGVWFLRRVGDALYVADHPQRLQPASQAEAVRTYLRTRRGAP